MDSKKRCTKYYNDVEAAKAKKEQDRNRGKSRVALKGQIDRWRELKEYKGLGSDEKVAEFLLNSYYTWVSSIQSTPAPCKKRRVEYDPSVSSIESAKESCLSGLEKLQENEITADYDVTYVTDDAEKSMTSKDGDYNPSNLSILAYSQQVGLFDVEAMEAIDIEELVADVQESTDPEGNDNNNDDDDNDNVHEPGLEVVSPEVAAREQYAICSIDCLQKLAGMQPPVVCPQCNSRNITMNMRKFGTSITFTWMCVNNHKSRNWASQKRVRRKGANTGDVMMASSVLLSGNSYEKIRLMFRFMNLLCVSPSTFHSIQHYFAVPAIEEHWGRVQSNNLAKYKDQAVVLAGDGRNDSPGHCAQFCSYTIMEHDSHDILALQTVDKRQVGLKSPNMEKLAWENALHVIEEAGITISEMVTDAHVQITSAMKKKNVLQSYDVWHGAKNLNKKIQELIGTKKDLQILKPWTRDIINHFWYCSEHCKGDEQEFKVMWTGLLYHIVNIHEWTDPFTGEMRKCDHGDLSQEDRGDKKWLDKESPAMDLLRKIVYDDTFMKKVTKYVNFRHTGELEVLHQHMLMYASKRFSYSFDVYRARIFLAAIDYQAHKDRPQAKTKDGRERFRRVYNKRTDNWFPVRVKEPKDYTYIRELITDILRRRHVTEHAALTKRWIVPEDHPKRIAPNLAKKPAPPTSVLVEQHQSRMSASSFTTDHAVLEIVERQDGAV